MKANNKDNKLVAENTAVDTDIIATKDLHTAENKTSTEKPDWAAKAEAAGFERKKTIGEVKFDNRAYIGWAGVGTFIFTIATAYILRDGRLKVPGTDYSFKDGYKKLTQKFAEKLVSSNLIKDSRSGTKAIDRANSISYNSMLTTVTFVGGFLVLPFIRKMEKNKAQIVRKLNQKHGTEADVELGEQNVKDEAPQSWGSILKGRVAAWIIVFTTFAGIGGKLIPNTFGGLEKDFEKLSGKVGSKIHKDWPENSSKFFEASEKGEMNTVPAGTSEKTKNQMYDYKRIGNLAAIDVFATAMSASLLYVVSKFFAKKKSDKNNTPTRSEQIAQNTPSYVQKAVAEQSASKMHEETEILPRKHGHSSAVDKRDASFANETDKEAALAKESTNSVQVGV